MPEPRPLSAAETVALCDALKKLRTGSAAELPDGFGGAVDFTVRITGNVSKGIGTPATVGTAPASVELCSPSVAAAVLKRLKVEPKELRKALRAVGRKAIKDGAAAISSATVAGDEALESVFAEVAAELVAALPPRPVSANARAGSVSVSAEVTRV